jgi:hypothetical protein
MNALPRELDGSDSIKSVTLADLEFGRASRFDRLKGLGKTALMLWGALSFGAAAGAGGYYFAAASGDPAAIRQAATASAESTEPISARAAELAEIPPHLSDYVDHPVAVARLPRPRPDEPVYTGSIDRPAEAHRQPIDPCAALASLGAPLPFRMRCERGAGVYALSPPRFYAPSDDSAYVVR